MKPFPRRDCMPAAEREGWDLQIRPIALRMRGLVIFRGLLEDPVVARLLALLECDPADEIAFADAYGAFCAALFPHTLDWGRYLKEAVLQQEDLYVVRHCGPGGAPEGMRAMLDSELTFLSRLTALASDEVLATAPRLEFLPRWSATPADLTAAYEARLANVGRTGYGMFARYHVFTVKDGKLIPVEHPDSQRLDQLPGYEAEREKVVANTRALLAGQPANNVLLYGDAGTGKSSAIKAIANRFAPEGLRLVEVKKHQLYQIPRLMDSLAANPLKFILFIDDLSFAANDDNFAALKAILEGSVGGRSSNIAVYATSNRRHLIKETLSDREGDDIHHADTMQELMSLSARFGLTVTFTRPDKERFSRIVQDLAAQYGVDQPADQLLTRAEAFAIRAGGRSPRVARQFIEMCKAGVL